MDWLITNIVSASNSVQSAARLQEDAPVSDIQMTMLDLVRDKR
jgi:hypothetical protein